MTNRAFEDLEKRSNSINRKRNFKNFIILLLLSAVGVFIYMKFPQIKNMVLKKEIFSKDKTVAKEKHIAVKKLIKKTIEKKVIVDINKTVIKAKKVLKEKKDTLPKYNTVFLKPTIVVPKIKKKYESKPKQVIKKNIQQPKIKMKEPVINEKKKLNITVKSLEDEASLLKENRVNENFETTMNLSKYYFKKSKFQKAILWSKKANHYKPSSFKPWLIYAKAKIKQDKKSEAIKALETFLSYFDSDEAQKFLLSIKEQK